MNFPSDKNHRVDRSIDRKKKTNLFQVMYSLLMPASDPMSAEAFEFQYNFVKSGHAPIVLEMLTKNNFLPNADVATKRLFF